MEAKSSKNKMHYYDCNNLGLVLLLPFFEPLFDNLQLIEGNQFKNKAAQLKGIQACHYLATGSGSPENLNEQDLIIAKLITGHDLDDHIQLNEPLGINEKQECIQLLVSVLEMWKPMNAISIEQLRASFLNRKGNVTIQENQYKLEFETDVFDIFLNSLPWGYINFKLPWMKKIIMNFWH